MPTIALEGSIPCFVFCFHGNGLIFRFHDLSHSYAVNALQAGDSVKAVQEQLGHYSSAFTMDVYAAVSDTMRKDSQERMEGLFKAVSDL